MRVGSGYLHLFVFQVYGRVGDERLGGHNRRQGVNQCGNNLLHHFGCGEVRAEGLIGLCP